MERCWVAAAVWRAFVWRTRLGADDPPMSIQLVDLGQQALSQGANRAAETFFKQALELDPASKAATDGLKEIKRADEVLLVAMQEPKEEKPAAPAADTPRRLSPTTSNRPWRRLRQARISSARN